MQENNNASDHLEQICEMNRLFLSFLHERARRRVDCLGLDETTCELLRTATEAQLDRAATVPRALFSFAIDALRAADAPLQRDAGDLIAIYSLQSKLLLSARNLCRQNAHLAQTFLGLPARMLIRLRCLTLIELVALAETDCLVAAGFDSEPWLWRELLGAGNSSERRSLRLIALQPRTGDLTQHADSGGADAR
jgi:hypothetical protein